MVVSLAVPALAHHAFSAMFDYNKPITVTEPSLKVDWINPHSYHDVEGKDEKGSPHGVRPETAPACCGLGHA